MLDRLYTRVSRLTLVGGLLALTLAVAAALAWQAHRAARSHEALAARVQRDYVEFAGWEFARAARQELDGRLERCLQVIGCAVSGGRLPEPAGLAHGQGCRRDDLSARALFQADIRTGALLVTGEPLGPRPGTGSSGRATAAPACRSCSACCCSRRPFWRSPCSFDWSTT